MAPGAIPVRRVGLPALVLFCVLAAPACRREGDRTSGGNGGTVAAYRCDGFAGPIQKQMEIQRGRTLPLKAQLLDAAGKQVTSEALEPAPAIRMVRVEGGAEVDESEQAASGDFGEGGRFVFREGYWKFDLDTADFGVLGTYRAELVSGDGSRYRIESPCAVTFVLKE